MRPPRMATALHWRKRSGGMEIRADCTPCALLAKRLRRHEAATGEKNPAQRGKYALCPPAAEIPCRVRRIAGGGEIRQCGDPERLLPFIHS